MAEIPAHVVGTPRPDELGPDPEPIGTRFEALLAQRRDTAFRARPVATQRPAHVARPHRRRAHVAQRGR